MIHTITLNPAVDYFMSMADGIQPNELNAASETHTEAGGKGINCSIVLNNLGVPSQMHALLGGATGKYIESQIASYPLIHNCSVEIAGTSRINVKITGKEEYILNAPGPKVTKQELDKFLSTFHKLTEEDYVILSGKAPQGTPTTFLYDIADIVNDAKAKLILDTRDMRLEDLTYCQPWLIKPNLEELGDLLGTKANLDKAMELTAAAIAKGAQNVLLTMGSQGCVFAGNLGHAVARSPQIKVKNTTGAGDTSLAAFVGTWAASHKLEDALRWSMAAGTAAAAQGALPAMDAIQSWLSSIRIEKADGQS